MVEPEELFDYLTELGTKLKDRDLANFWVMPDRADFRPIKNVSKAEIKKLLKEKAPYYKNKKIAEVDVYVNPKNIHTDDFIMSILVFIYEIDEDGKIESKYHTGWGAAVNFYPKDLKKVKFSLKLVETIMRLANDQTMVTNTLTGMKYGAYVKALKKKGIDWDL